MGNRTLPDRLHISMNPTFRKVACGYRKNHTSNKQGAYRWIEVDKLTQGHVANIDCIRCKQLAEITLSQSKGGEG